VSTRWSLGMSVKSRSDLYSLDWSGAAHYRYCCQWMERVSPCLCLHSEPTLQALSLQAVGKWTTRWVNYEKTKSSPFLCIHDGRSFLDLFYYSSTKHCRESLQYFPSINRHKHTLDWPDTDVSVGSIGRYNVCPVNSCIVTGCVHRQLA